MLQEAFTPSMAESGLMSGGGGGGKALDENSAGYTGCTWAFSSPCARRASAFSQVCSPSSSASWT